MKKNFALFTVLLLGVFVFTGCNEVSIPRQLEDSATVHSETEIIEAGEEGWLTDFEKAKQGSAARNVPILVDFSGSDWCGWCIKLDREVFSQPEFKAYAKDHLVLFLADFPRTKAQSAAVKAQNEKLSQHYGVQGFPTVLLLNADGSVIEKTGYQRGGASAYVEHIQSLLK